MDVSVAATAQSRQVLEVARTRWGVPNGIDVMRVQATLAAANDAGESVPLVDSPGMTRRPGSDQLTSVGHAALPEIGCLTGTCGANVGETFGRVRVSDKAASLPTLSESRELRLFLRGELETEDAKRLPDGVIRNTGPIGDRLDLKSLGPPSLKPLAIPVSRHSVDGELRTILAPSRAATDADMYPGGLLKRLPSLGRQAQVILGHLHRIAVLEGHFEDRTNAGFPNVENSGVVDLARLLVTVTEESPGKPVLEIDLRRIRVIGELMPCGALDPELWCVGILRWAFGRLDEAIADLIPQ